MIGPSSLLIAASTAAGLLTAGTVPASQAAVGIAWGACAALLLHLLARVAAWPVMFLTVTDKRMILVRGVVRRKVTTIPLADIADLGFQRPPLGLMFGYGTFIIKSAGIINSAGQDRALRRIRYVPYPEQLYLEVCALLVPPEPDDGT
jgi:membrane protein YdbS with pleckstrin-like domain